MAFVMVSRGALANSGVRTLSLRGLVLGTGVIAVVLLCVGVAIGFWFARGDAPAKPAVAVPKGPPVQASYTIEQLGALAGRLFRLENEAALLGRRLGVSQEGQPHETTGHDGAARPARTASKQIASGGPMLPPRSPTGDPIAALDDGIRKVEAQLARIGSLSTQRALPQMFIPSRMPIDGVELGSPFGNRMDPITHRLAFHGGLDFAANRGTEIRAAAGGMVVFAGWSNDFGWLVEIDHGNGLLTRYAHASKLAVKIGMVVAPGDVVSYVGSSGRSTGPHLHFEVLRNGQYVDPQDYLAGL